MSSLQSLHQALFAGENYQAPGLGEFTVRVFPAYVGRSPIDGSSVPVPEKREYVFKADRAFKRAVAPGAKPASTGDPELDTMVRTLLESESTRVGTCGRFTFVDKPARVGRNPQTGDKLVIPGRRLVRFLASGSLRRALQGEAPRSTVSLVQLQTLSTAHENLVLSGSPDVALFGSEPVHDPVDVPRIEEALGTTLPPPRFAGG